MARYGRNFDRNDAFDRSRGGYWGDRSWNDRYDRDFGRGENRFGAYGGRYVPETLMAALEELQAAYARARELCRQVADPGDRPDANIVGLASRVLDQLLQRIQIFGKISHRALCRRFLSV